MARGQRRWTEPCAPPAGIFGGMPVTVETGTTLAFDRFWRWLKRHPNCILRAGTSDAYLYEQEDLHWHLEEDDRRAAETMRHVSEREFHA